MQRWPVESSQIASVGYDSKTSTLEVEFKRGGAIYQYAQVPSDVHEDLMHSPSIGKFFNANVRDKYKTTKLEAIVHAASEAQASPAAPEGSQAQASPAAASADDSSSGQ